METSKEEMMMLMRELQDLQMWLFDSLQEITLSVNFSVSDNSISIDCYTALFSDIYRTNKSVFLYSCDSYEKNRTKLNRFVKYVKKLAKYGCKKGKPNQTPTGKARV